MRCSVASAAPENGSAFNTQAYVLMWYRSPKAWVLVYLLALAWRVVGLRVCLAQVTMVPHSAVTPWRCVPLKRQLMFWSGICYSIMPIGWVARFEMVCAPVSVNYRKLSISAVGV